MTDIAAEQSSETPVATLDYRDVEWVWVTSHYDIHLAGLCRYRGELCRFETHDDDIVPTELPPVSIYALTPAEKLTWLLNKKCFEWMVGRHFSYPPGRVNRCAPRRPQWLSRRLSRLYFAVRKRLRD